MEEKIYIKAITLSDGSKIELRDYLNKSLFEEDVLEYISEDVIEYYAMRQLELNTEEYHLENADDDDLVDALEDNNYNFAQKVDVEDCIDIVEQAGYTVTDEDEVDRELDYVDNVRLNEIVDKFINGSWSEKEELYNRIING